MNKQHLEHRKRVKKRKPTFLRQDVALTRLTKKWRRPRGIDSKRRLRKDGHQKRPSIGYSSPSDVRGLTQQGLREIVINNPEQLKNVTKDHSVIVGRTVGTKKRLAIINKAKELKLTIANLNVEDVLKKQEEKKKLQQNKKKKEQPKEKKETQDKKEEKTDKTHEEKLKEDKRKVLENTKNVGQNY